MPVMKLRHPLLVKAAGLSIAITAKMWVGTLNVRYRPVGPSVDPTKQKLSQHYIFAFWHEYLLLPAFHFSTPEIAVMISQHRDGEVIAEACRHIRLRTVRGSTTRGGMQAARQMVELGNKGHLVITPDGPRGPRRRVQTGLVYLASKTGLPIIPVGVGFDRPWRMRSWDRFCLPRPWSLGTCVSLEPVRVPSGIDRDGMEIYRRSVEEAIARATEMAERQASKAG
jgi:lysophospholipid acyltransferase (LPLAT)-like uncharacterized protein